MASDVHELARLLDRLEAVFARYTHPPSAEVQSDLDAVKADIVAWYTSQGRSVPPGMFDPPRPAPPPQPRGMTPEEFLANRPKRPAPAWKLPKIPMPQSADGRTGLAFTLSTALMLTIIEASYGRHIALWRLPLLFLLHCFVTVVMLFFFYMAKDGLKQADPVWRGIGWAVATILMLGFVAQIIGPDLIAFGNWMGKRSGDGDYL